MQESADRRRVGTFQQSSPCASPTWGTAIASIPNIQSLELILETFAVEKAQLDAVVECAKTWRFPIVTFRQVLL
ncbi:predicted protein [Plenodomus lingam JN3]|uniref:Predicted protein n=1 Tax=Leptosphaeria maculans (strain JN3 / isolate v23.1.3 / race Av1-4-5-6-7-8) TaxID=985895 RepID=E5A2K7_LEPMJ|nr:predicted protein [Plenodomus lingam JN3]CBX97803.1 predicted protein [Plenodomus lingam JN3]